MRRGKPIGRNINFEPTTGRVGLKKLKSLENSTTRFHEIEDRRSKPFFRHCTNSNLLTFSLTRNRESREGYNLRKRCLPRGSIQVLIMLGNFGTDDGSIKLARGSQRRAAFSTFRLKSGA